MATRMLIDARHPEETRVAVLKGNRIEEFDFESAEHKQIKGNIYLAKVTRVEPSLQAAFVDFGGNRHGFLAFSEIHPDYYQIPQSDRDALIQAEREHAEEEAALRAAEEEALEEEGFDDDDDLDDHDDGEDDDIITDDDGDDNHDDDGSDADDENADDENGNDEAGDDEAGQAAHGNGRGDNRGNGRRGRPRRQGRHGRAQTKEMDELREKRQALRRRYKIQDVIQRRQVLLVQVVKEERGNKGAALTTYLSLAGRYCVLMPNSSSGGGISRKISSSGDRKRLKQIVSELSLPRSMGLIVRTAGLQRTKTEIKRDFDYLARLWDDIREKTMSSSAPSAIHSDSDLVKRAIRDIYNRDIEEVIVEGEAGYKAARTFMKLLMPSHVRKVKAYSDPVPLFQRFGAEDQLSAMYDPVVQLKSGGYLVINPTEALVSIDINSGRSTKELGIEQTAVATNMEAANEIARQLRLRDMAGLVVIDFIDMEYGSNVRKVEKCMREALKNDRARIQVGRISSFGLMEMSRQRLRTGVLEATTRGCPHCDGTGLVRTASSAGLSALRFIEDEAAKGKGTVISLFASTEAAVYLLNAKRADLSEIEHRYGVDVEVIPEGENEGAKMRVVSSGPRPLHAPRFDPIVFEDDDDDFILEEDEYEDEEAEGEAIAAGAGAGSDPAAAGAEGGDDGDGRRKRRRRRRGGRGRNRQREGEDASWSDGNGDHESAEAGTDNAPSSFDGDDAADDTDEAAHEHLSEASSYHDEQGEEGAPRRRRRRGGRRRRKPSDEGTATAEQVNQADGPDDFADHAELAAPVEPAPVESASDDADRSASANTVVAEAISAAPVEAVVEEVTKAVVETTPEAAAAPAAEEAAEPAPKPKRTRRKKVEPVAAEAEDSAPAVEATEADAAAEAPKPKRTRRKKVEPVAAEAEDGAPAAEATEADAAAEAPKPKRTRRKKVETEGAEAAPAKTPAKAPAKPRASRAKAAAATAPAVEAAPAAAEATPAAETPAAAAPAEDAVVSVSGDSQAEGAPRRGWWQRTFGA